MPKDGPYWQQVWNGARIVENSRYLASRHLATPPTIRFHKKVQYEQGTPDPHYPAMVCPFTSSLGRMMGVHVTFLGDGKKADCPIQRKQLTDPGSSGGAVRLFPAAEEMGVAEGIETALSASKLFGMPVWAALNTSLLKGFVPPPECKRIWIFGDHDPNYAGHVAAYGLAHRLYGKVEQIKVKIPLAFGDWNDVLIGS
jgi:putative DNA primase/helicase